MYKIEIKDILITCLFSLCFGMQAKALSDDKVPKRTHGIRFGYQYSNMRKSGYMAYKGANTWYFGYVQNFHLIPLLHLQSGLEYMTAGASESESRDRQLQYIVLPLQGVVRLGLVSLVSGANGNFLVSQNLKINGDKVDLNSNNEAEKFDLTLDAGLSINFWMLSIELRYYLGTMEVKNGWYNRFAQVGAKVNF